MLSCYVIKTLHHLQSNHDHLMSAKNKETISQSSILRAVTSFLCIYPDFHLLLLPVSTCGTSYGYHTASLSVKDLVQTEVIWRSCHFVFIFKNIFFSMECHTNFFFHIALMLWLLHHLTDDILSGDSSAEFPVFASLYNVSGVCWLVSSSSLILCNLTLDCLWRVVFVSHSWSSLSFLNLSVYSFHKYWRLFAVIYLNCFYSHPMLILFREHNSTNVLATFSFLQ